MFTGFDSGVLRWNLRTGVVEVFDGLFAKGLAASSSGWFVAGTDFIGSRLVLVASDRTAFTLP